MSSAKGRSSLLFRPVVRLGALGVAIVAVLVVNAWQHENQMLAFLPIATAVAVAWLIGEWVTERVFVFPEDEVRHGAA